MTNASKAGDDMDRNAWWNLFESTGSISAYLQYKHQSEEQDIQGENSAYINERNCNPEKDDRRS